MRLRQCCDHPYLTLRKGSGQSGDRKDDAAFADLDKLLTRFMDDKDAGAVAYASKMMDELRNGNADEPQGECPVCLGASLQTVNFLRLTGFDRCCSRRCDGPDAVPTRRLPRLPSPLHCTREAGRPAGELPGVQDDRHFGNVRSACLLESG